MQKIKFKFTRKTEKIYLVAAESSFTSAEMEIPLVNKTALIFDQLRLGSTIKTSLQTAGGRFGRQDKGEMIPNCSEA